MLAECVDEHTTLNTHTQSGELDEEPRLLGDFLEGNGVDEEAEGRTELARMRKGRGDLEKGNVMNLLLMKELVS